MKHEKILDTYTAAHNNIILASMSLNDVPNIPVCWVNEPFTNLMSMAPELYRQHDREREFLVHLEEFFEATKNDILLSAVRDRITTISLAMRACEVGITDAKKEYDFDKKSLTR